MEMFYLWPSCDIFVDEKQLGVLDGNSSRSSRLLTLLQAKPAMPPLLHALLLIFYATYSRGSMIQPTKGVLTDRQIKSVASATLTTDCDNVTFVSPSVKWRGRQTCIWNPNGSCFLGMNQNATDFFRSPNSPTTTKALNGLVTAVQVDFVEALPYDVSTMYVPFIISLLI